MRRSKDVQDVHFLILMYATWSLPDKKDFLKTINFIFRWDFCITFTLIQFRFWNLQFDPNSAPTFLYILLLLTNMNLSYTLAFVKMKVTNNITIVVKVKITFRAQRQLDLALYTKNFNINFSVLKYSRSSNVFFKFTGLP